MAGQRRPIPNASRWLLATLLLALSEGSLSQTPIPVLVSVLPQKYFVERIGGSAVDVSVLVGPGQSPATYELSPQRMAQLVRAKLYFRIGVPVEDAWISRIRATNPSLQVIDAREHIPLRPLSNGHHEHVQTGEHHLRGSTATDPHIWTSPPLVKIMARQIRDQLKTLDPSRGPLYDANYERFAADLDRLDGDIRHQLAALSNRKFLVFHPSWGYFADTYGLQQRVIEADGKSPGIRRLANLIDQARADGIKVVLVQQQFSRRDAQAVADAIGARLVSVDPLAYDYPQNLRQLAAILAEANRP